MLFAMQLWALVLENETICGIEYSISGTDKYIFHTEKGCRKSQWHNHLKDLLDLQKPTETFKEWACYAAHPPFSQEQLKKTVAELFFLCAY